MAEADQDTQPTGVDPVEQEARRQVKKLKEFYNHAGIYVVINIVLIAINLLTSPGTFWAVWPLMGWGVGLAIHAVEVFGMFGIGSHAWEEKKVRELVLQRQRGLSAEQVKALLHEELRTEHLLGSESELTRVVQRLENLEAIVTSQDWDLMQERSTSKQIEINREGTGVLEEPETKAAKLAKKVH